MEIENVADIERLLKSLDKETIDKMLCSARKAPNGKVCLMLPEPKNETEKVTMEDIWNKGKKVNYGDPSTFPKIFPFL